MLTLSATPIPRTMQMSLIGIRSLCQIQTPPEKRMPIQTYVTPFNFGVVKELIEKFSNIINNEGKVESVEELGKKKLAYEIKKNSEGIYVLINFEAAPSLIKELERVYRITDEVIKFIVVRKDEE